MSQKAPSIAIEDEAKQDEEEDDRVMKDVVAPPRFPLAHNKLFRDDGSIDLEILGDHLNREGRITLDDAFYLVKTCTEIYKKEPNLLRLRDPITVCGDVHGQFFDLLRLMEAGGDPADTQYLFLGDYVDRGCFSTECVFFLCAHKITYKDTFYQIRGNHECRHLTSFFNFKDECLYKYNLELYDAIMLMFDQLPIAATINSKFLCCHGGLSPDISTVRDIEDLDRFQEVPREGPFCDLLWADPVDDEKEADADYDDPEDSMDAEPTTWFAYNETRQCSYVFGIDAVTTFLKKNNLTAIIRAHEAQFDGYKMQMINEQTQIPRVITIFSAPNYCDVYKNKGACLKFDDELLNIRQFVSSPHPYYLPNFMDVFTWSLPFVAEKVTDMLYSILSYENNEVDIENATVQTQSKIQRGGVLKGKVVAVTKLMRMYKVLKENQNNIVRLKQLSPNGKLPSGVLSGGATAIDQAISSFQAAKAADKVNEAVPSFANGDKQPKSKTPKKHKGPIFFSKSMDTSDDKNTDDSNKGKNQKRRKMTITKDEAK
jgi:serine/threonine-protein phosphatase 2B catalytic subunit